MTSKDSLAFVKERTASDFKFKKDTVLQEIDAIVQLLNRTKHDIEQGKLYRNNVPMNRVADLAQEYSALVTLHDTLATIKAFEDRRTD